MSEKPAPNWLIGIMSAGLVVALVGGAILFAQVLSIAEKNSGLICAFGTAIGQTKVEQRAEENLKEFKKRIEATKDFTHLLHDLEDCEPPIPVGVKIKPEDRQRLKKAEAAREDPSKPAGGDALQTPSPASQPPSPSPPSDGPSPQPEPPGNPEPPTNPPPPPDGPVGEALDTVCEVTNALGVCIQ
jgi:hypothetical protein